MASAIPGRTVAALVIVQILFGLHPVVSKLAFPAFGPGGVSVARVVGAAVVFQSIRLARREAPLPWRVHAKIAFAATFGIVANQLIFLYGLSRTSATHAALLITTVPVVALLVALLSGREPWRANRVAGIAIALAGAAFVILGRGLAGGGEWLGDAMVMGNAVCYGIYLVLGRELVVTVSPWSLASALFTWGAPMVLCVTGLPAPDHPTPESWAALGFTVLGPTVGTYLLNLLALRAAPASVVAVFVCLQPLVAAAIAVPLLHESPDWRTVGAGVVTVGGMLLATREGGRPTASAR